jgi:hypothetical protein
MNRGIDVRGLDLRNIDVRHEVSKVASSKPVQAAAGVGVAASEALRDLPGRLGDLPNRLGDLQSRIGDLPSRLGELQNKLGDLPNRLAGLHLESAVVNLPARATGYVLTARSRAVDEYERLAQRGRKALSAQGVLPTSSPSGGTAAGSNGKATTGSKTARSTRTSKTSK